MTDYRIVPVDSGIPGASSPTTSGKGTLTLAALSEPQIGDMKVRDGKVWRLIERELEGDVWEFVGLAAIGTEEP